MKVTLDLAKLLHEGAITPEERDRLLRLSSKDTGLLLVNILIGFGVFAVSGGVVLLVPNALTGIVIGAALLAAALCIILFGPARWRLLANICILIAAILLGAGIILFTQGMSNVYQDLGEPKPILNLALAYLLVFLLFAAGAFAARSGLLAALAVLMLFTACGSTGGYEGDGFYGLDVTQPFAVVVLFSALALAAYFVSRAVPIIWEGMAIIVARTALFLVNLGFWVGSLWGDDLTWANPHYDFSQGDNPPLSLSAGAFAIAWAVALVGAGLWAGRANRRWLLNIVAVFGAIHFYTQWFEHIGASPISLLCAGLLVLVFAFVLWQLNHRPAPQPA